MASFRISEKVWNSFSEKEKEYILNNVNNFDLNTLKSNIKTVKKTFDFEKVNFINSMFFTFENVKYKIDTIQNKKQIVVV